MAVILFSQSYFYLGKLQLPRKEASKLLCFFGQLSTVIDFFKMQQYDGLSKLLAVKFFSGFHDFVTNISHSVDQWFLTRGN